jgi:transposase
MNPEFRQAGDVSTSLCFIPELLSDELIYSWLGRLVAVNALGHPKKYLSQLFGTQNIVPCVDLPTHLEELHDRLGVNAPYDSIEQLIELGTLYPYHRPFLTQERHEQVHNILIRNDGKALKVLIGRVANGFGANPPLRYCPICVLEDTQTFGTPYWKRSHQLPSVKCCIKHRSELTTYISPNLATDKRRIILAPYVNFDSKPIAASEKQLLFAELSTCLLNSKLVVIDPSIRKSLYVEAITSAGFITKSSHIDYINLSQSICNNYDYFDDFIYRDRLLTSSESSLNWLRTLIQRPERASHPICHLLLIGYLFKSVEKFNEALTLLHLDSEHTLNPSRSIYNSDLSLDIDAQTSNIIHDSSLSCRKVANILNLSVTTIVCRRRVLGLAISERRKSLTSIKVNAIKKDLLSGLSPSAIVLRQGISISTAYRIRAQLTDTLRTQRVWVSNKELNSRRQQWLQVKSKHLEDGITAARSESPSTYAWLYKHDRAWLRKNSWKPSTQLIPKKLRIDWATRDLNLLTTLADYVASIKQTTHRPRISKSLMFRKLGESMIRANLKKMPQLEKFIQQHTESIESYQRHRIDRSIQDLRAQSNRLQIWKLKRFTGIRNWSSSIESYAKQKLKSIDHLRILTKKATHDLQ